MSSIRIQWLFCILSYGVMAFLPVSFHGQFEQTPVEIGATERSAGSDVTDPLPWDEVVAAVTSREAFNEVIDFTGWRLYAYWVLAANGACPGPSPETADRPDEEWADLLQWRDPESGQARFCAHRPLLGHRAAEPRRQALEATEQADPLSGIRLMAY